MENWEIQKPGFLDKTPSISDAPAFLAVLGSPGMEITITLKLFNMFQKKNLSRYKNDVFNMFQ